MEADAVGDLGLLGFIDQVKKNQQKDDADTVTTFFESGGFIVTYWVNGMGTEKIKRIKVRDGDFRIYYTNVPFTCEETGLHRIWMKETFPGWRTFDFDVYFPNQKSGYVRLTQRIQQGALF